MIQIEAYNLGSNALLGDTRRALNTSFALIHGESLSRTNINRVECGE